MGCIALVNLTMTELSTDLTRADGFTELAPSYNIPMVLIAAVIPLVWLQVWVAAAVGIFGLFLLVQTALIRLRFTSTALEVYRSGKEIRRFPYSEWEEWQIFWQPLPVLFYFREVKSIHFLPVLFQPQALRACLEQHCPR
jgi:Protein of unknown function (DUF3119)